MLCKLGILELYYLSAIEELNKLLDLRFFELGKFKKD